MNMPITNRKKQAFFVYRTSRLFFLRFTIFRRCCGVEAAAVVEIFILFVVLLFPRMAIDDVMVLSLESARRGGRGGGDGILSFKGKDLGLDVGTAFVGKLV